jgi:hypothetical protein
MLTLKQIAETKRLAHKDIDKVGLSPQATIAAKLRANDLIDHMAKMPADVLNSMSSTDIQEEMLDTLETSGDVTTERRTIISDKVDKYLLEYEKIKTRRAALIFTSIMLSLVIGIILLLVLV